MFTILLLSGCTGGDAANDTTAGATDTDPVSAYESTLAEIESSTSAHGDAVLATTDVDVVARAESDYWSFCQTDWGRMNSCWDAMSGCGMMGGNSDGWSSWMNDMWAAMQDHHDAMAGCTDIADCHTREMDWQAQMDHMFSDMHGMSTSWPDDCGW